MDIRISQNANPISPMKTGTWTKPTAPGKKPAARDEVHISSQGREAAKAQETAAGRPSQLDALPDGVDKDTIMAQLADWRESHRLEANWNATVDPDGSVYAKSYMESLVRQYDQTRQAVESYYQEGHQENLRFSNPHDHLLEKYQLTDSPYFRADMSKAQRDMAFRQEEALLWGRRVTLNDPWALASVGGVPSGQKVEKAAQAYAQSVLDGMIADYKRLHGID